jgi:hypothetical protein
MTARARPRNAPSAAARKTLRQARPLLTASDVVNTETGVFEASETRTSTGTFLEAGHDEVVRRIEKRVAQVTMTPVGAAGHGERRGFRGRPGRVTLSSRTTLALTALLASTPSTHPQRTRRTCRCYATPMGRSTVRRWGSARRGGLTAAAAARRCGCRLCARSLQGLLCLGLQTSPRAIPGERASPERQHCAPPPPQSRTLTTSSTPSTRHPPTAASAC